MAIDRAVRDALLTAAPAELYKRDGRSEVYRVTLAEQAYVIKRFTYARWRQTLGWLIGRHPGQIERRKAKWLAGRGIAVVPIETGGLHAGRYWLATKRAGISLDRWLRGDVDAGGGSAAERAAVLEQVGVLAGQLLQRKVFFKDLKASNIVVGADGQPRLIDVGAARRGASDAQRQRMLAMLEKTCREAGVSDAEWAAVQSRLDPKPG